MARILPLVLLLAALPSFGAAAPPPQPADDSPAALLAALSAEDREAVLSAQRVVSFAESREANGKGIIYRTLSLGVLPHSPRAVKGLFARTTAYPTWVTLSPTYKAVRAAGGGRIACDVGKSSSKRPRETLTYHVEIDGPLATWNLTTRKKALQPGSSVSWEVVALRDQPGRTLLIHRQTGRLSGKGRLSNYLDSSDKQGRNRYWKDASKHARRLHWAMDAALTHPPGSDREDVYLDRYAAEFNGGSPYWAN